MLKNCLKILYAALLCFLTITTSVHAQSDTSSTEEEEFFADEVVLKGDTLLLRYHDKKGRLKTEETRIAGLEVYTRYYSYRKEYYSYYEVSPEPAASRRNPFRTYYPDGRLRSEGTFVRRKYDGPYKTYYRNGQPACVCSYSNGKRNGLQQIYTEDGKRSFTGNYIHDLREGIIEVYHSDGMIWTTRVYKNDHPWTVLSNFNTKGEIMEKGTLKDGDGTLYLYDENGKPEFIETYRKGKLKKTKRIAPR